MPRRCSCCGPDTSNAYTWPRPCVPGGVRLGQELPEGPQPTWLGNPSPVWLADLDVAAHVLAEPVRFQTARPDLPTRIPRSGLLHGYNSDWTDERTSATRRRQIDG